MISPSQGLAFEDVPNGFGALYAIPLVGWTQIIALAGILEINFLTSEPKEYPGDYEGFGALGLPGGQSIADKETKEKKLLAEINNGRLAMMAIIGMFFQNGLTGQAWGDWSLYTDSPMRAATKAPVLDISTQLGACPPLGFWDPLGLAKANDPVFASLQFRRRRTIELQHGRVSMFACIGYIVPEYFRWPGFISPSQGLAFEDIPNGFGALYTIPFVGITQILAFVGICEINFLTSEPKEYPGDYEGFGALGLPGGQSIADKETKEKKLLAEINNGRLAMMAIIGMFFQNGLTGQAWGDWSLYTDSPMRAAVLDISTQLGACPPLGFWDPLGLAEFD